MGLLAHLLDYISGRAALYRKWEEGLWGKKRPGCVPPVLTFIGHSFSATHVRSIREYCTRAGMVPIFLSKRYFNDAVKIAWAVNLALTSNGLVIPAYETATRIVAKSFAPNPKIVAPPVSVVRTFENKRETSAWLRANGFAENVIRDYAHPWEVHDSPVYAKPISGSGGRSISILHKNIGRHKPGVFYQEAVRNNTEWGAHFAAVHGTVLFTHCISLRFKEDVYVRRHKNTVGRLHKVESSDCPADIRRLATAIARKTVYHGIGCIGIKFQRSSLKLIEVNARLCGMAVSYKSGEIMSEEITRLHRNLTVSKHCEHFPSHLPAPPLKSSPLKT